MHQISSESLPSVLWDVIIVGAGPAGATAAIHLARAGHHILLLDKQVFPREKACGDGLLPDAVESLKRSGVYEDVRQKGNCMNVISVFSPSGHEMEIPGAYLTLERIKLDAILASKAVDSGATFAQAKVKSVTADGQSFVVCTSSDHEIRGRIGLIATGAHLDLLKPTGMIKRPHADAIALRCYIQSTIELDRMVFSFDRSIVPGYAWIFPLGDGRYNVGCGISLKRYKGETRDLRRIFDTFLVEFPIVNKLLAHGEICSPVKGAILRYGLDSAAPISNGNVMAIGETIGATYPFSGEGIGKAMETAEIAAQLASEALTKQNLRILQDFPEQLEVALKFRYAGYFAAERWVSWPWFIDLMAVRAQKSRFLRRTLAGIVNETADPRDIFSVRGFLRMLCT